MHRFRFEPDLNLVIMEYGEQIDDAGLLDFLIRVYDHPDFVPGMDELSSFLSTRESALTGAGLRNIAQSFPRPGHENAPPNVVAVVTQSKLGHGLTRMYGAYAEQKEGMLVESFPTMREAADWIDVRRGREAGTIAARLDCARVRH